MPWMSGLVSPGGQVVIIDGIDYHFRIAERAGIPDEDYPLWYQCEALPQPPAYLVHPDKLKYVCQAPESVMELWASAVRDRLAALRWDGRGQPHRYDIIISADGDVQTYRVRVLGADVGGDMLIDEGYVRHRINVRGKFLSEWCELENAVITADEISLMNCTLINCVLIARNELYLADTLGEATLYAPSIEAHRSYLRYSDILGSLTGENSSLLKCSLLRIPKGSRRNFALWHCYEWTPGESVWERDTRRYVESCASVA